MPIDSPATRARLLCVLVPTRNEAANIAPLLRRLEVALADGDAEVLFVDDSTDDTPQRVRAAASNARLPVRLLHRPSGRRTGGLGGAVAAGLALTTADWVVVMDGDLQHPPEVIPVLLTTGQTRGLDVVVASRYCASGSAAGLASAFRGLISSAAGTVAKLTFPRRLRGVTDPMSGFFAIRAGAVEVSALRPQGFKILVEILARIPSLRIGEVPFTFAARREGESKASCQEAVRYLRQLAALRLSPAAAPGRLLRFAAVGASGVLVNLLVLRLLLLGLPPSWPVAGADAAAASTAAQVAIGWNFTLTERWAFTDHPSTGSRGRRLAVFWALSAASLIAQLPLAAAVQTLAHVSYLAGTAGALGLLVVARFAVCDRLVYARASGTAGRRRRADRTVPARRLNASLPDSGRVG